MKYSSILTLIISCMLSSCMSSKFFVSPPFTSTDEITSLTPGMSLDEVNKVLGINPYEFLSIIDGDMWLSYNYRVKNLITPITSFSEGLENAGENKKPVNVNDPESRNSGEIQYGDWGVLYVQFEDGVYRSSITDFGVEKSNNLEIITTSINNHNSKFPVFMVNDKAYVENKDGVLQSVDWRRCRMNRGFNDNKKQGLFKK